MGNSTSTIPQDRIHPVNTPLEFGKKTNHFADGLAPIMGQVALDGEGPKFASKLDRDSESTTSKESYAHRKL